MHEYVLLFVTNLYGFAVYQILDDHINLYVLAIYQFLDDYILGYEIVNEPWCGDVYEVPFKCI